MRPVYNNARLQFHKKKNRKVDGYGNQGITTKNFAYVFKNNYRIKKAKKYQLKLSKRLIITNAYKRGH